MDRVEGACLGLAQVDPAERQDGETLLLEVREDLAGVAGGHAVGFDDG